MYKRCLSIVLCSFFLTVSLFFPPASNTQAEPVFEAMQTPCDPEVEECTYLPLVIKPPIPPEAFTKSAPLNDSSDQPVSLTLDWETSPGAASYEYCLVVSGDPCSGEDWISTDADTQVEVGELSRSTSYTWQVHALNSLYTTAANDGTWWTFTTTSTTPPAAFGKVSPIESPTHQPAALTLDWGDALGATEYKYCIDTVNDNACNTSWISTGSNSQVSISGLAYNTIFRWQVKAINAGGSLYADGNVWWSITTIITPPAAFNKTTPPNTAVDQPVSLDLVWQLSQYTTSYEYCIDTTSNATCDGDDWISNDQFNIAQISGLEYATSYYWQVRARNADSDTYANGGAWHTFHTVMNNWHDITAVNFETSSLPSGWSAYDAGAYSGVYFPARRTCRPDTGSYSGWMVGGGTDGAALACGANYPNNAEAWLSYGTFSLRYANAAYIGFDLWLNAQTNYDYIKVWINNGSYYAYDYILNPTGGWQQVTFDLGDFFNDGGSVNYLHQTGLTIAIIFESNYGTTMAEGAYIDNILLRECTYDYCSPAYPSPSPEEDKSPADRLRETLNLFMPKFGTPGVIIPDS